MAIEMDVDTYFDELDAAINRWTSSILEEGKKMVPGMIKAIDTEYREYQDEHIKEIFEDAIDKFYRDYGPEGGEPKYYGRNHSLYDLLDVNWPTDGSSSGGANGGASNTITELSDLNETDLFNSENATPFERGGGSQGLYELVFKRGYHGGAAGTDRHGKSVSIPHWRTPYPGPENGYKGFSRWGQKAERANISPYNEIMNAINGGDSKFDAALDEIVRRHADTFQQEWQEKADALSAEIFAPWM